MKDRIVIWWDTVQACYWVIHERNGINQKTVNRYKITDLTEAQALRDEYAISSGVPASSEIVTISTGE